jgi:Zinc-binding dehydrogenase
MSRFLGRRLARGDIVASGGERELYAQAGSGPARAVEKDPAAERLDPVLEADQAGAIGEAGAARTVVADHHMQDFTAADNLTTARRMGADEVLVSADEAVARIKDMTRGQGAHLVLDTVGADPTLRMAAQVARVRGHLTIVSLGGGVLPVNFFSPPHECSVASPY